MTRNIKLVLEYDGAGLSGWQRQAGRPTVQGHVEKALSRLTGAPVTLIGAGRTDAGVHARGQAANFKTASPRTITEIVRGGNALLPRQIAILSAREVADDFHARYSAVSKVYDYDLDVSPVRPALRRNFAWHLPARPDIEAMSLAAAVLIGRHDFACFQSTGSEVKTSVRTVLAADLTFPEENLIRFSIQADGFLRHMVRSIVGTLVLAGQHRIGVDDFQVILEAGDRSRAGPTAPARGLYLREVFY